MIEHQEQYTHPNDGDDQRNPSQTCGHHQTIKMF